MGQAQDLGFPPPRPKKKPNYPYPRKTAFDEKTLKNMNPLPQELIKQEASVAAKSLQQTKECSDEAQCSVVLNLFQDAPSSSSIAGLKDQSSFREYVPIIAAQPKASASLKRSNEVNMDSTLNENYVMAKSDQDLGRRSGIDMELHGLLAASGAQMQLKKQSGTDHEQGVDGSNLKDTVENGDSPSTASPLIMNHPIPTVPAYHTCSALSYISHPSPSFPPLTQIRSTQDFYRSFLGTSSAFSSQIVSTLMQNPAVHTAACITAASLWPLEEIDTSNMAAIAAATVAAASAWWSTIGLIPFFPPNDASGFPFSPPSASFPVANTGQAPQEKIGRDETHQNSSNTTDQQAVASSSSSSNLEEIEKISPGFNNAKPSSEAAACHDLEKPKIGKHGRSSCGSNTTSSSSEIETKDAVKQAHSQNLLAGEANTRRTRSSLCFNETWKEVSQQGRLAFQALFTRDVLPQSFPTQLQNAEMGLSLPREDVHAGSDPCATQNCSLPNETKKIGNLKVRRTGFKPYKRCSAEAVEILRKSAANDETSNKKVRRLEGEVSS